MRPTRTNLREQEALLRAMINAWDPIGLIACGTPEDEYDCITHRVLGLLHSQADAAAISKSLATFLPYHFGSAPSAPEIEAFAVKATEAWAAEQERSADA